MSRPRREGSLPTARTSASSAVRETAAGLVFDPRARNAVGFAGRPLRIVRRKEHPGWSSQFRPPLAGVLDLHRGRQAYGRLTGPRACMGFGVGVGAAPLNNSFRNWAPKAAYLDAIDQRVVIYEAGAPSALHDSKSKATGPAK